MTCYYCENRVASYTCYVCKDGPATRKEVMSKTLQDPIKTQQSLMNLREELERRAGGRIDVNMVLWKINSCLYSHYPACLSDVHGKQTPEETE